MESSPLWGYEHGIPQVVQTQNPLPSFIRIQAQERWNSFLIKLDQFASVYLGFSVEFNYATDDPAATVVLLHNQAS